MARPDVAPHLGLGRKGERLAAQHLQKLGFVVLSKNWRCREGEIDIVATNGKTLVVCEVKTRAGEQFGEPAEAVTEEKIARIRRITGQWLRAFSVRWCTVRFDVIAVLARPGGEFELRHFPGAF
ncbi:YraN family protein [Amycolatopsis acididurans]|uniref:YraN family protein n=1 Tax=Amycolatopsis acididurans TaxID=2724524 RepID=UPI0028ACE597|nr:YraN family protein [Amycolatopsis acididurans]